MRSAAIESAFPYPSMLWVERPLQRDGIDTDVLAPFAFDEAAGRYIGQGVISPLIHLWRHPRAFVMGLRDRRLPYADRAIAWLKEQGFAVAVRHSGGAAVPLDSGVMNISMIVPKRPGQLDVREDFTRVAALIAGAAEQCGNGIRVTAGEIAGSYCPGEFDLSIDGRKFCGIAQRRQTDAVIIQAFVIVSGSGPARGELVRRFYDLAAGPESVPGSDYPLVVPERMGGLQELLGREEARFRDALLAVLSSMTELSVPIGSIVASGELAEAIKLLRQRYDR